ncbi:hypothetical protein [Embleya sp. NPDC005971]|uniref:hypothetical protein n=1 Tax=Embleya sp. NPDC005971 TaxID=3156724 RepID=UPI00340CCF0C
MHTTIPNSSVWAAGLWITILNYVYGLGGPAVRMQGRPMLRVLAGRRGTDHGFTSNGSWLRHGFDALDVEPGHRVLESGAGPAGTPP